MKKELKIMGYYINSTREDQVVQIKELKRANEILRKAAAFFAQAELDRPHK